MASALTLMKHGVKTMDLGHGLVGWGLNAGLGLGAGYALGQTYHRYRDTWAGRNAPRLTAVAGKLGAVALQVVTGGPSIASGALDAIGQSGLTMMGCEIGLAHVRKATGFRPVLVPTSAALPSGGREITSIAGLGEAPSGRVLSMDEIEELASMH